MSSYQEHGNYVAETLSCLVELALIEIVIEELEELRGALRPRGWLIQYTLDGTGGMYAFTSPRSTVDLVQIKRRQPWRLLPGVMRPSQSLVKPTYTTRTLPR